MKYKVYSRADVKRILKRNDFQFERSTASHDIYIRNSKHISIPHSCNPMLIRRLFKENNIKDDN